MNTMIGAAPTMVGSAKRKTALTASQRYAHGGTQRRFTSIKPKGHRVNLGDAHPAIAEGRTLFPSRVVAAADAPRLLIDGRNSRKIGHEVESGKWAGFRIFTLTLEERKTCPSSCAEWRTCYGNGMNWARRVEAGPDFEERLWLELAEKQAAHPKGFVVRLHVLGDFYSVDYVALWAQALMAFPALRVFGYTARDRRTDPIGAAIGVLVDRCWSHFAVRFSGEAGPRHGAIVVNDAAETPHLICPAQQYRADGSPRTECCATCALCFHSDRTIAFLRH